MNMYSIQSFHALKEWTSQYKEGGTLKREVSSSAYPILLDWFLDWFFITALSTQSFARDAFKEYVAFTYICSTLSIQECVERCLRNLTYWEMRCAYSTKYGKEFSLLKKWAEKSSFHF